MVVALVFLTILILSYLLGCIIKFGIPNSLSETYYSLGKYSWIFQLVMLLVGVGARLEQKKMIEFPIEMGILCWTSTIVFWVAVVMVVIGIIRIFKK